MGDDAIGTLEVSRTELLDQVDARFKKGLDEFFANRPKPTDLAPHAQADPTPDWIATLAQGLPQTAPRSGEVIPMEQGTDGDWHILDADEVRDRVLYAEHRQGAMAFVQSLDNVGGLDIPWGSIIAGGLTGAVAGELVDGFFPLRNDEDNLNPFNPLVKIAVAAGGARLVDRQLGRTASILFAGALGVQILATLLPLDEAIASIIDGINGLFGGNGNGDESGAGSQVQDTGHRQLPVTEGPDVNPVLAALSRAAAA